MKKNKQLPSLKWSMIAMLLICWVLPVVLVVSFSGIYIARTIEQQTKTVIVNTTENVLANTKERLNAAVSASFAASYNPTLLDAWIKYRQDNNYNAFGNVATKLLSQQYKFDDKFLSTYMLMTDDDEHTFTVTDNRPYAEAVTFWKNMTARIKSASAVSGTDVVFMQDGAHLYMMRNLYTAEYYGYAILVMELNQEYLFADLEEVPFTSGCTLWLNDVAVGANGAQNAAWRTATENAGEVEYQILDRELCVFGKSRAENYEVRYVMPVNTQLITQQLTSTKLILLSIVILLAPLLCIMLLFFHRKITLPMNHFAHAAKEIENGKFGIHIKPDTLKSAEFGYLGDSFNDMSDTLKNQFERIFKEELALRDARIMALQSQINPHFLNNTLEIINWEARIADDIKVCKMIEALSTMLGAAMDRDNRPLVHLSEELMYVDSYLYIIRERLGKRLTVIKEIDDKLLDCFVPRLVLQPIIENAVEHGVTPARQGEIILRAYRREDKLYLEIENDSPLSAEDEQRIGALLSDEKPGERIGGTSLGIHNVNQRLKILYGNTCGLLVNMTKTGHTLAQISIQIQQDAQ